MEWGLIDRESGVGWIEALASIIAIGLLLGLLA